MSSKSEVSKMLSNIVLQASSKKQKDIKTKPVEIIEDVIKKPTLKTIPISKIKNKKLKKRPDSMLSDWTSKDFAIYFVNQVRQKIDKDFDCGIVGLTTYIPRIHDAITDLNGYCDNTLMKNYFDFLFDKILPSKYRINNNKFYVGWLRETSIIERFILSAASGENVDKNSSQQNNDKMTKEDIKQDFLLGTENLYLEWGVIIGVNWLVSSGIMDIDEALEDFRRVCKKYKKKEEINKILEKTEYYSPYPSSFIFKDITLIKDIMSFKRDIHVVFTQDKNNKFDF